MLYYVVLNTALNTSLVWYAKLVAVLVLIQLVALTVIPRKRWMPVTIKWACTVRMETARFGPISAGFIVRRHLSMVHKPPSAMANRSISTLARMLVLRLAHKTSCLPSNVEEKKWKTYAFHALASQPNAPASLEETTLDHLLSLVVGTPGASITLNDDGAIRYQFETPAIRASRINPREALNFANSIFGPSNHYEKPLITFADGEEIPADLLAEAEAVCDRFTYDIGWQHGDIVLIDNTRVMHGRRQIEDKSRTIYNALSYIA